MHLNRELHVVDAEQRGQGILVGHDPSAVGVVVIEEAVYYGKEPLQVKVLLLIKQVVLVLRTKLPRIWHLILLELLGVNVPFSILKDVQNDRFLASPHDWLPHLADLVDFVEQLDHDF